jgi:hypothetical protein
MSSRAVNETDRECIALWIQDEESHTHSADFYVRNTDNNENFTASLFSDNDGPLFVARLEPVLRLHMDFNLRAPKERLRASLLTEIPNIEREAREQGYGSIIFESVSRPLIAFAKRRFGFRSSPNELIKNL